MHALLAILDTDRLQKARHRILRSRVTGTARQPVNSGNRRHAHDRTVHPLDIGKRILRTIDAAPEIYIHQLVQHRQIDLVEQGAHRNAGIADQHIHPAERIDRRVDQSLAIGLARHVAHGIGGVSARRTDPADNLPQRIFMPRPKHRIGARSSEIFGQRPADYRRSAGHDHGFSLKKIHIFKL